MCNDPTGNHERKHKADIAEQFASNDRNVAMARNGQRRRGLRFSRDRPSVAMARNEEFGNEEEDWDLDAINRSVAMARNRQRRRGLGFRRDRPSVAMARNEEFGNEEEDWDLDAIDRSVATALARQSHLSHRPEELAAIDERVELHYQRKLTMRAAAVSVKSDDDKPTSASVVVEKPYFFNKLMRFSSKRGNQDCRESDQDRSNYSCFAYRVPRPHCRRPDYPKTIVASTTDPPAVGRMLMVRIEVLCPPIPWTWP
ncbi:hypothetical protein THAOC_15181, partial [Thalassiosira oceanica]